MKSQIFTVEHLDTAKMRLDKWVSTQMTRVTRSYVAHLIDIGCVIVNGKIEKPSFNLKLGDRVTVEFPQTVSAGMDPVDIALEIIHEDEDLLVINKPAGLVVHPAAGHEQDTLVNALLFHVKNLSMKSQGRPGIVHRIDKDTSGLLVVAKNDWTHEKLAQQFKDKTVHRVYFAVVEGALKEENATMRSYLARAVHDRKKYASVKNQNKIERVFRGTLDHAKWAVTHYRVLKRHGRKILLRLQLETGRTHQIRIHLSEAGAPIVGDCLYGYPQKAYRDEKLNRFYLHAGELGFVHPRSQREMLFKVPWPTKDFEKIVGWGL